MVSKGAPSGWDEPSFLAWGRGEKQEAINLVLARLNQQREKSPRLTLQLCYYLFFLGDFRAAAHFLTLQLKDTPKHPEVLLNLAVCYGRAKKHQEAVHFAKKVLEIDRDSYVAFDVLSNSLHGLKMDSEAALAGARSLEIKDRNVQKLKQSKWVPPQVSPEQLTAGKLRVISFSLWGNHPRYLLGALHNAVLASEIYPGWICRFYVDSSVPEELLQALKELGANIIYRKDAPIAQKLCWRFEVANDPDVGYFVVRDVDSVIGLREAQAVQEWIDSKKWFHVMRDWWTHTDLILAGMWGGVANVLPSINTLYSAYTSPHVTTPNIDQWFLRDCVWSMVKQSCLMHDRCFRIFGSIPFASAPLDGEHIGQNEFAAHPMRQEKLLEKWISSLPCLSPKPLK